MFFDLGEDRRLFCEALEKMVQEVSPTDRAQRLDNSKAFDEELHGALARLQVLGLGVPEAQGGAGGTALEQVLALEILGRRATSMAVFLVVQYMVTRLFVEYGSEEQRRRYLGPLASGKIKSSFCMTEATGGTDVLSSISTRARGEGDRWILSGSKMWISGATRADVLVVAARTDAHRTRGLTLFLVPKESPGLAAREVRTMAINGFDTCEVTFSDVSLPEDSVLGRVNEGFYHVLSTLNDERLNAAAVAVGIGRGAHEAALAYAKERQAFGRPIGAFQAVQHRLVEAGVGLEAAWLLTLRAALDDEAGRPIDVSSSMAKLAASRAALAAADVGMETLAGAGFDLDHPMQRYYRDARLYVFAPLTNDMLRNLLGERWLGLPRSF